MFARNVTKLSWYMKITLYVGGTSFCCPARSWISKVELHISSMKLGVLPQLRSLLFSRTKDLLFRTKGLLFHVRWVHTPLVWDCLEQRSIISRKLSTQTLDAVKLGCTEGQVCWYTLSLFKQSRVKTLEHAWSSGKVDKYFSKKHAKAWRDV